MVSENSYGPVGSHWNRSLQSYAAASLYRLTNEDPHPIREHLTGDWLALETVINRCLQKDPDDRYATAAELEHQLATAPGSQPLPKTRTEIPGRWVATAVIAILFGIWIMSLMETRQPELGGVATLPFHTESDRASECRTYGELVSRRLNELLRVESSPYWGMQDSDIRQAGVESATEAGIVLGAGLAIGRDL